MLTPHMEPQLLEKLDLRLHDIAADEQAALRAAFSEGGKIDFEGLKVASEKSVDAGKERYGMNWPGKGGVFQDYSAAEHGDARAGQGGVGGVGRNGESDHRGRQS